MKGNGKMGYVVKWKKRIYELVEIADKEDRLSRFVDGFIISLIIINIIAMVAESYTHFNSQNHLWLKRLEIFTISVFSIEYILRIWTAKLKYPRARHAIQRYIFSPMAIVDLLSILPFYLSLCLSYDLSYFLILRLFRILHVLKLHRYFDGINLIAVVLRKKSRELVAAVMLIFILLVIGSILMYYIESPVQPDKFPNIPTAFWWAVETLTTVGYGDIYPITGWGQFVSGVIAFLGVGLVALPTGILSSGFLKEFTEQLDKKEENDKYCPNCGKKIK